MHRKSNNIRRIILVIIAVLLAAGAVTPWGRRIASAAAAPFAGTFEVLADGIRFILPGNPSKKNRMAELESENQLLKAMLAETEGVRRENVQLRQAASLPLPPLWKGVPAQIIARDPERWQESFTINRGYEDGIKTGAAVVIDGYFAGRIRECSRRSSVVSTVFSPLCSVSAYIGNVQNLGVLRGDGSDCVIIEYLPRGIQLQKGAQAYTSGMGGWMPSGIPIAHTAEHRDSSLVEIKIVDTAYAEAVFTPLAKLNSPGIVTVIVPEEK